MGEIVRKSKFMGQLKAKLKKLNIKDLSAEGAQHWGLH
jgi:hypothetical protein